MHLQIPHPEKLADHASHLMKIYQKITPSNSDKSCPSLLHYQSIIKQIKYGLFDKNF